MSEEWSYIRDDIALWSALSEVLVSPLTSLPPSPRKLKARTNYQVFFSNEDFRQRR
jgi:hypothetical protein